MVVGKSPTGELIVDFGPDANGNPRSASMAVGDNFEYVCVVKDGSEGAAAIHYYKIWIAGFKWID